jgi:hypothetical protein
MNNAAHVATGGEVSDHQRQEAPFIAKLGYQWRLVQMAKVLKLEIYRVIFQILAVKDVSIMASWHAGIFRYIFWQKNGRPGPSLMLRSMCQRYGVT